jgi:hypothetical protein
MNERRDRKSHRPPGILTSPYEVWNRTVEEEIQRALLREDYEWAALLRMMRLP